MEDRQPINGVTQGTEVPLLSMQLWLSYPTDVRLKLVKLFSLKRSGATETNIGRDGIARVISDGYRPDDLQKINVESMQKVLETNDTDFYKMFGFIVENIDWILDPARKPKDELVAVVEDGKVREVEMPKQRGRPKKIKSLEQES